MTDLHTLRNARLATMQPGTPYGLIDDGAIALEGDRIAWVGPSAEMPDRFAPAPSDDLGGRLVTPGLIDAHTHVVFGGNRAAEFELRLNGASYEEVARAGGGIVSTVKATRAADVDALVEGALLRVDALISEGVTTIEIKSGYGLDRDTELNMLRAARRIAELRRVRVQTSFSGRSCGSPGLQGAGRRLYRRGLHSDATVRRMPKGSWMPSMGSAKVSRSSLHRSRVFSMRPGIWVFR